ncbi:MAG TPA: PA0069 family radical SAM protein [Saprospiraceae bacterium]|nr:PA0069 family radical SAM protein [Saprospiraceae bacterium]
MSINSSNLIEPLKGRAAQGNLPNPFQKTNTVFDLDLYQEETELQSSQLDTKYILSEAKSLLNRTDSGYLPFQYSANPYQGCEHGCIYCYARPTHTYWGYGSGLDFESKIIIKHNAAAVLEKELNNKKYEPGLIELSGNTDCYQPAEKEYKITRQLLEVFLKYKHPVSIITKNSLILRDLDLLTELHRHNLVNVCLSITSLRETTRRILEPRTASVQSRLKTLYTLVSHGIPTSVMMAPIIPGINDDEIIKLVQKVSEFGARSIHYQLVRLEGDVRTMFETWVEQNMPDKKDRIMKYLFKQLNPNHYDSVSDPELRKMIKAQFDMACNKYLHKREHKHDFSNFKPNWKMNELF